jgi:hypothetical protein
MELFAETKDYINYHIWNEEHLSYVKELKAIRGFEQMTKFDRFSAHGIALLGDKRKHGGLMAKRATQPERPVSIEAIMRVLTH